jgi:lysophospholipase L1-like esterase
MPLNVTNNYTLKNKYTLSVIGDSLSFNYILGVKPEQFWPTVLVANLRSLGALIKARNYGKSGNTTTQMVARIAAMTQHEVPDIGIIWGGVNDPGSSIVGATTQSNITSMVQTLLTAGCSKVIVLNTQYLNYSSSGDTTGTPYATYATLRPFQKAAVDSFASSNPGQVVLCDLYTYMRALIVAGTETQGSFSWHVADSNQHLNVLGNNYVAAAVLATIQAQTGWVNSLS